MVVPLSHAEENEASFLIAWSDFNLRKCRYDFFMSDYQQGGVPRDSDVADYMG